MISNFWSDKRTQYAKLKNEPDRLLKYDLTELFKGPEHDLIVHCSGFYFYVSTRLFCLVSFRELAFQNGLNKLNLPKHYNLQFVSQTTEYFLFLKVVM